MNHCIFCGKGGAGTSLISEHSIDHPLGEFIQSQQPDWSEDAYICAQHLTEMKLRYLMQLIRSGIPADEDITDEIISVYANNLLTAKLPQTNLSELKLGEKLSDRVAKFGGSWTFIILFVALMIGWMLLNSIQLAFRPFDPYPFIFLNLILSCIAAIQAPIIMMSQNRKEQRDEKRAEEDFRINLKAEIELRLLHDKIDHLIYHQLPEYYQKQEELIRKLKPDDSHSSISD